jgi:hypothetical protein
MINLTKFVLYGKFYLIILSWNFWNNLKNKFQKPNLKNIHSKIIFDPFSHLKIFDKNLQNQTHKNYLLSWPFIISLIPQPMSACTKTLFMRVSREFIANQQHKKRRPRISLLNVQRVSWTSAICQK